MIDRDQRASGLKRNAAASPRSATIAGTTIVAGAGARTAPPPCFSVLRRVS
jgi:hypothetical protein